MWIWQDSDREEMTKTSVPQKHKQKKKKKKNQKKNQKVCCLLAFIWLRYIRKILVLLRHESSSLLQRLEDSIANRSKRPKKTLKLWCTWILISTICWQCMRCWNWSPWNLGSQILEIISSKRDAVFSSYWIPSEVDGKN